MISEQIQQIPIAEIRVANPRTRNKVKFQEVVTSIGSVGLKRPITVSQRALAEDGTRYDLACGQGRIEACLALGESTIPAIVTDATREECYLMSLVENIARRPPSNLALISELKALQDRGYKPEEMARKLGLDQGYMRAILNLLKSGEEMLINAVEAGRMPVSVAVEIARGNDREMQAALSQAYEKGVLRGAKLASARRIVMRRVTEQNKKAKLPAKYKLTSDALVREYRRHVRLQQDLVEKATATKDRLILLTTAMRTLMGDDHFVALLRAEQLADLPEPLASRMK